MENHRLSIFDTLVLGLISESQKEELTGWKHDELLIISFISVDRTGLEIHMDMENGHIIKECTKQLKQYLFL